MPIILHLYYIVNPQFPPYSCAFAQIVLQYLQQPNTHDRHKGRPLRTGKGTLYGRFLFCRENDREKIISPA